MAKIPVEQAALAKTEKESAAIKVRFERHDKRIGILEYKLHAAQEALNIKVALRQSNLPCDEIAIVSEGERQGHYHQQTVCILVRVLRPTVMRLEVTYLQKGVVNA